jgi:hypothetical protein
MVISYHCFFRYNTTREKGDGNKLPLSPEKKVMATSCRHFLCWNTTIEEDNNTLLSSSFSSQTQRRR